METVYLDCDDQPMSDHAARIYEAHHAVQDLEEQEVGPCDSCSVMRVQGVRCHEYGCARRTRLDTAYQALADAESA